MAISITLPQRCHQDWDKMTPAEKGRHCSKCDKEVVDFTGYSRAQLEEVMADHFIARKAVCGHFNTQILDKEEEQIFTIPLHNVKWSRLQIFAFAFVFAFLLGGATSCKVGEQGIQVSAKDFDHLWRGYNANCSNDVIFLGLPTVSPNPIVEDSHFKIYFDTAEDTLDWPDQLTLGDILVRLEKNEQYKLGYSIEIVGHTDSVGAFDENNKLSFRRAEAARNYLMMKSGIEDIDQKIKDVRGVGYQFPAATNATPEGRAQNRRVEIIIDVEEQE